MNELQPPALLQIRDRSVQTLVFDTCAQKSASNNWGFNIKSVIRRPSLIMLKPRQNGCHFADCFPMSIFLSDNCNVLIQILL